MTVRRCVTGKGLSGPVQQEAEDLLGILEQINADERLSALGDLDAADRIARAKAEEILKSSRARKRLQEMLQIEKTGNAVENSRRAAPTRRFGLRSNTFGNGIQAHLGFDIHHSLNDIPNVETVAEMLEANAFREMAEFVENFRAKGLNIKRPIKDAEDFLDALHGEATPGSEAAAWADDFFKMNRHMVANFKEAGGHLPERVRWFPNPNHDMNRVRFAAGHDLDEPGLVKKIFTRRASTVKDQNKWVEDVLPLLDRERMVDFETNLPLSDKRLREVLSEIWETLRTDGLNKLEPGSLSGRKLANMRADPRILEFKDATSWRRYNELYGDGDVISSIFRHIKKLARDTALLRVLGPDPDRTMRVLLDTARKEGVGDFKRFLIEDQYRIVSGRDEVISHALASVGQNGRHLMVANNLGSAAVTALSDNAFMKVTTEFNGLSATRTMRFYAKAFVSKELQINMTKQNIIIDDLLGSQVTASRFMDVMGRKSALGRVSDTVLRASLLTQMTSNMRRAFGMMVNGEIWDNLSKSFDNLDKPFQRMLKRYGFTADDWKIMKKSRAIEYRGEKFFDAGQMIEVKGVDLRRLQEIGERVQSMIIQETNFAVPTSNARVQSLITLGSRRGGPLGEIARFVGLYKRFPILILHTHAMRVFTEPSLGPLGRTWYAARLMAYTTLIGTMSWQLGEVIAGREPVDPVKNPEVWARGMLKGGALGIWGDLLLTDVNGYGRGLSQFFGPGYDFASDALGITAGNVQQLLQGKPTNLGREMVRFFDKYLSPGSTLWYLRGAWDRIIIDNLNGLADPDHAVRRNRRMQRTRRREFDQGFLVAPGSL